MMPLKVLADGDCIGIYPEGTRSPDGRLYKGRTGIARLAIESGAPVIPVAMSNTDKIQPTGKVIPNVKRVGMNFGTPMYFDGDSTDLQHLRDVTDQIMNAIHALSDQEYIDIYAPKKAKLGQIQEED